MNKNGLFYKGYGIFVIFGVIFLAFAARLLWQPLSPFVLAWLVSLPTRRLAKRISSRGKISFCAAATVCLLIEIAVTCALVGVGLYLLSKEVISLYGRLLSEPEYISELLCGVRNKLSSIGGEGGEDLAQRLGLSDVLPELESIISNAIFDAISSLGGLFTRSAVGVASALPSLFIFFVAFFTSCFYLCRDKGEISEFFMSLLPPRLREGVPSLRESAAGVIGKYLTASLTLCGITFFIVVVGLLCINCRYALLISLVIALIDFLPLLGAPVILLPWSIVCFVISDVKRGVALLIICIVVYVVRQIAEPRLIGKQMGLHPLAALSSVYIGAKTWGVAGLFLAPLVAVALKGALSLKTVENKGKITIFNTSKSL